MIHSLLSILLNIRWTLYLTPEQCIKCSNCTLCPLHIHVHLTYTVTKKKKNENISWMCRVYYSCKEEHHNNASLFITWTNLRGPGSDPIN